MHAIVANRNQKECLFDLLVKLKFFVSFQFILLSKKSNFLSMKYDHIAQTKLAFFASHAILTLLLRHPK